MYINQIVNLIIHLYSYTLYTVHRNNVYFETSFYSPMNEARSFQNLNYLQND